jgi:phosphatidylglycerophosphate synthase
MERNDGADYSVPKDNLLTVHALLLTAVTPILFSRSNLIIAGVILWSLAFFIILFNMASRPVLLVANGITVLRVLLGAAALTLGVLPIEVSEWVIFGLFTAGALTDLADGFAARRNGPTPFGGLLDGETDALFIWFVSVYLFYTGKAPSAVLICALLRYLFIIPFSYGSAQKLPKSFSWYAKTACAFAQGFLVAAAAPTSIPPEIFWISALVLLGTSFLWEWALRMGSPQSTLPKFSGNIIVSTFSMILLLFLPGFYFWFPEYSFMRLGIPVLEGAFFLLTASLLPNTKSKLRKILTVLLGSLAGITILYSGIEGFLLHIFRQSFNPWSDIPYISNLFGMVTGWIPSKTVIILLIIFVLCIAALAGILLYRGSYPGIIRRPRLVGIIGAVVFSAAVGFSPNKPLILRMIGSVTPPNINLEKQIIEKQNREETAALSLPGLQDANALLFVAESYGMTIFTREEHFSRLKESYTHYQNRLKSAGIETVSGKLKSPITGGRSWIAEAELMTGIPIDTQGAYDKLLETDSYSIPMFFNDAGYTTIFAAPGTTYTTENWNTIFPFKHTFIKGDFGYEGPRLSMGEMPDQYLVNFIRSLLNEDWNTPLFIETILVSSHTPFDIVPAYVTDWDSLGNGSIFKGLSHRFFDNGWLAGGEYPEGYTASIDYVLGCITRFAELTAGKWGLMIVLGDHQPRLPIRERYSGTDVPIHILSSHPELLTSWKEAGFTPGLIVETEAESIDMSDFFPLLRETALSPPGRHEKITQDAGL